MSAAHETCLCIHGHFYQPPRENPWLGEIELQESAAPYHDWNERIHQECYLPNATARILDDQDRIADIVNNYEKISFNFGPTLLSWLEAKHPDTYRAILNADRSSRHARSRHGNAIAQVYNHMILPLATRRDKVTQVRWGVADFRHRFGRDPEAIWIAETAVDEETLEVLVEEGMKFLILSPHQARAVRPLGEHPWQDVSAGCIDPKRAYRCFLEKDPHKSIDVFFYDGPISKDVGFGDLLFEAKMFMGRLLSAKVDAHDGAQLIHLATDGESFGHHRAYGERAIAYLVNSEASKHGLRTVNYAEFLEAHPPREEVKLKEGGTSWSCAHGVKRWSDDCGCRGGGPAHWHQRWRSPLRQALDWLRGELSRLYEARGTDVLKDIWAARDDYMTVVLDRSEKAILDFLGRHAPRELSREEVILSLKLLEMQRHAMLMYTSCGWFFTELSGIETVQILMYAARAIELAQEILGREGLEEEFLLRLEAAPSNVADLANGRGVYEALVRPRRATMAHIASCYAICGIFEEFFEAKDELALYCYKLGILARRKESYGDLTLHFGRLRVTSRVTLEESDLAFIVVQIGLFDFRCSVKPLTDPGASADLERELFEELRSLHVVEILRRIDAFFGHTYYALKDLPLAERTRLIRILTRESVEKMNTVYENLYEENRRVHEICRSVNLPIPEVVRFAAEHTLTRRLSASVAALAEHGFTASEAQPMYRVIDIAKSFGVELKMDGVSAFLSRELCKRTKANLAHFRPDLAAECLQIMEISRRIGVSLDDRAAQDHLFRLVRELAERPQAVTEVVRASAGHLTRLLVDLRVSPKEFHTSVLRQHDTAHLWP